MQDLIQRMSSSDNEKDILEAIDPTIVYKLTIKNLEALTTILNSPDYDYSANLYYELLKKTSTSIVDVKTETLNDADQRQKLNAFVKATVSHAHRFEKDEGLKFITYVLENVIDAHRLGMDNLRSELVLAMVSTGKFYPEIANLILVTHMSSGDALIELLKESGKLDYLKKNVDDVKLYLDMINCPHDRLNLDNSNAVNDDYTKTMMTMLVGEMNRINKEKKVDSTTEHEAVSTIIKASLAYNMKLYKTSRIVALVTLPTIIIPLIVVAVYFYLKKGARQITVNKDRYFKYKGYTDDSALTKRLKEKDSAINTTAKDYIGRANPLRFRKQIETTNDGKNLNLLFFEASQAQHCESQLAKFDREHAKDTPVLVS